MKTKVLYLSADAPYKAVKQFKNDGKVSKVYFDLIEIYSLDDFESAFNDDERISDLGFIKFMDELTVTKYYIEVDYYDVQDVLNAGYNLSPIKCRKCGSLEVTFNQGIGDASCGDCGVWQLDIPVY